MKKIEFGFNDDKRLNASWSGIEFYNGEYLDVIGYEEMDLLVTKIVDSLHGLNGKIDVREIAQDYYSDGSFTTYANKEKNNVCIKLESLLNTEKMQKEINSGKRIYTILRNEGLPVRVSTLPDVVSKYENASDIVTSVMPDKFNDLKESKKNNRGMSMYDMAKEIERLNALLKEKNGERKM